MVEQYSAMQRAASLSKDGISVNHSMNSRGTKNHQKMKSLLQKVGTHGGGRKGKTNDEKRDLKQQQQHMQQQGRDDEYYYDELHSVSRGGIRTVEDGDDDTKRNMEVGESLFNPLGWVYAFSTSNGNENDYSEEKDEKEDQQKDGYQADQERDQDSTIIDVEFDVEVDDDDTADKNRPRRKWMKKIVMKRPTIYRKKDKKKAQEKDTTAETSIRLDGDEEMMTEQAQQASTRNFGYGSAVFEYALSTFALSPKSNKKFHSLDDNVSQSIALEKGEATTPHELLTQEKEVSNKSGEMIASKSSKLTALSAGDFVSRSTRAISKTTKKVSKSSAELASRSSRAISKTTKKVSKSSAELASRSSRAISKTTKNVSKSSAELASQSSRSLIKSAKVVSKSAKKASLSSNEFASRSSRSLVKSARKVSKTTAGVASKSMQAINDSKYPERTSHVLTSTALKSSRAIALGAKELTRSSSRIASKSSRAVVKSTKQATMASKALASSVKRLIDANQKKVASRLVLTVHGMIQQSQQRSSAQYRTPGQLLHSIHMLIQETELKLARNRRLTCRDRRQNYRETKAIEYVGLIMNGKNTDNNNSQMLEKMSALAVAESITEADYYSSDELDDDDDDDWSSSSDDDDDEDDMCTTDDDDDEVTVLHDMTQHDDEEEDGETDTDSDDRCTIASGYSRCSTSICHDSIFDDITTDGGSVTDHGELLSPKDKAILMGIENDLAELEGMHEKEEQGWMYRTFFPDAN